MRGPLIVVPGRLELPTSTLSVWRSNQLSYRTDGSVSRLPARPSISSRRACSARFFLSLPYI